MDFWTQKLSLAMIMVFVYKSIHIIFTCVCMCVCTYIHTYIHIHFFPRLLLLKLGFILYQFRVWAQVWIILFCHQVHSGIQNWSALKKVPEQQHSELWKPTAVPGETLGSGQQLLQPMWQNQRGSSCMPESGWSIRGSPVPRSLDFSMSLALAYLWLGARSRLVSRFSGMLEKWT